jgi:hypothetical protein
MPILDSAKSRGNGIIAPKPVEKTTEILDVTVEDATGYKPVSVDLRWLPKAALLQHVSGSAWIVDYFSQVLTSDSDLSGQQLSASGVYQQYTKIAGLELRVSSVLSNSQTDTTGAMEAVGSAIVYPFMRPNVGDMFLAVIPDGQVALFRVTASVQKSISKETCYEISYGIDTTAKVKIDDLLGKVVRTVYYKKDFLAYGKNPLLIKEDAENFLELEQFEHLLGRDYVNKFYSNEFNTYLVPGQPTATYDHFLNGFLGSLISSQSDHRVINHRKHNLNDELMRDVPSLWTMLRDRSHWLFGSVFEEHCLVSVGQYFYQGKFAGIRWSGLDKMIFPQGKVTEQLHSVDYRYIRSISKTYLKPSWLDEVPSEAQPLALEDQWNEGDWVDPSWAEPSAPFVLEPRYKLQTTQNLDSLADFRFLSLKPVTHDSFYVFSSDFWKDTEYQNALERMVRGFIRREPTNVAQLVGLCKLYRQWGLVEQFYFVPVLLVMVKNVLRGVV